MVFLFFIEEKGLVMKKLKYIKAMMETARVWAKESYCKKRKVGAVIACKNHTIISTGFNGTYPGKDNKCEDEHGKTMHDKVIHAEMNALNRAKENNPSKLIGATIYVTTLPCIVCARKIVKSGIDCVVYESDYKDSESIELFFKHKIQVIKYNSSSETGFTGLWV